MKQFFSDNCKNLIESLLETNPKQRLGANGVEEIQKHPFFSSIDWKRLEQKKIEPPFIPDVKSDTDLKYFDQVRCSLDFLPRSYNYSPHFVLSPSPEPSGAIVPCKSPDQRRELAGRHRAQSQRNFCDHKPGSGEGRDHGWLIIHDHNHLHAWIVAAYHQKIILQTPRDSMTDSNYDVTEND